jgi:hypothetical protein
VPHHRLVYVLEGNPGYRHLDGELVLAGGKASAGERAVAEALFAEKKLSPHELDLNLDLLARCAPGELKGEPGKDLASAVNRLRVKKGPIRSAIAERKLHCESA